MNTKISSGHWALKMQAALVGLALVSCAVDADPEATYYPPPDSQGGWRTLEDPGAILELTGADAGKIDEALEIAKVSTKNGGLVVVHRGWLIHEKYFGLGHREALTNLASVGKSFTSMAAGMILDERADLFPDGLAQTIYHPDYLPEIAFPVTDPEKSKIKLGQLLTFSSGIRGNNPSFVRGKEVTIDPPGLDGWSGMVDSYASGKKEFAQRGITYTAQTLWIEPGGGYSYATASIHLVSMMVRHLSGMEMETYLRERLAKPLGFEAFGFGYQQVEEVNHTPGGGGVVVRPTDMVRFGYLLLKDGVWKNEQVVPVAYVIHCRNASPYNPHYPYSLQFNVNSGGQNPEVPRDAFWKYGSGGHALFVVPSLELVIWKLGGRDSQYRSDNIGMLTHPDAPENAPDRANWKAGVEIEEANIQILNTIVSAVE